MASCNDCVCSEVCYYKSFNDVRNLEKRRNDVEKICKSFVYRDRLKNGKTVVVVEVVRCKDCRYFSIGGADRPWCRHESGLNDDVEPDYFCSYGERRADNG